jgi:hypothetical protein
VRHMVQPAERILDAAFKRMPTAVSYQTLNAHGHQRLRGPARSAGSLPPRE